MPTVAKAFCIIFVLAAALRLTLVFGFDRYEIGRPEPIRIAISLAEHGSFADPYAIPTGPTAHSPPLYPMMIAPLYAIWGNTQRADFARFILNTLAAAAEYALLPMVAIALGLGAWPGILAGLGGALIPLQMWVECMGDFETTWTALFLEAATILFAHFVRSPRFDVRTAAGWGLFWGAGCLLNPDILPVLIGFAAIVVWKVRPDVRIARRSVAAFAAGAVVVLAPWIVRNYFQLHGVFFVRDNFGLELFVSNHDGASPHSDTNYTLAYFRAEHPHMSVAAAEELRRLGEVKFENQKLSQAIHWIWSHPRGFAQLMTAHTREFWFASVPRYGWALWSVSILAFAGWIMLAVSRGSAAAVLGVMLAGYSAIYSLLENTLRYEHPLWWIQMLLIGWMVYATGLAFCP